MPRKDTEGAPLHSEQKMSEETRKKLYGQSEKESAPSNNEGTDRHYSGASESGSKDSAGSDKHS